MHPKDFRIVDTIILKMKTQEVLVASGTDICRQNIGSWKECLILGYCWDEDFAS